MSEVRLVRPGIEWKEAYISFYEEWKRSGEDIVPWVVEREPYDYEAMLRFLEEGEKEECVPEGWVPHSTYWLVDDERQVVGAVNLRHRLNDKLLRVGGHIGYGIRPSARRKGYATRLLALALQHARELGLIQVLVVCDKGNVGSERVILRNGGVFESEAAEEDGNVVRRFWIEIRV
jgi:predicted acetyltransferase